MNWPVFLVAIGAGLFILCLIVLFNRRLIPDDATTWVRLAFVGVLILALGAALI